ncbi:unnamed protein product [Rotaria socialis]|uniref:Protein kinase domain-containing protein n=1 Tax=Rotaria socialis TaxID=392032 RepID=A0A818DTL5_9BILA|nr:unnamed protein product [Rotaria socialis]CAF3452976.1 unnamed protein product [Rotaria socialis]CAF4311891.1 unnamed protein product [Rotaria socialis]
MFRRFMGKLMPMSPDPAENDEEQFCLIRWLDKNSHEIVPQRYISASSISIVLYETYQIKIDSSERKGTVILKKTESTRNSPTEEYHTTLLTVTDILADIKEESNNNNKNEQDDVPIQIAVLMKLLQLVIAGNSSNDNDNDSKFEVHKVCDLNVIHVRIMIYAFQCLEKQVTTKTHTSDHPLIVTTRLVIQQIPVEDIELDDELGRGAFGSVFKAKWISRKRSVACKVIAVTNSRDAELLEESFLQN